jgi:hypothetical protein
MGRKIPQQFDDFPSYIINVIYDYTSRGCPIKKSHVKPPFSSMILQIQPPPAGPCGVDGGTTWGFPRSLPPGI